MAKILLVEDDKSLREIYGVRLLAEGYDIVSAGDGEEALAMAIKEKPQLIISDVMMPKISGFDMLDILRSTTETRDIKVIMMTALSSDDQRARGEQLGADKYLVKSQVGIEDVVRTVHEVLSDKDDTTAEATTNTPTEIAHADAAAPATNPAVPTTPDVPAPSEDANVPVEEEKPAEDGANQSAAETSVAPGNEDAGPLPPQPTEMEPKPEAPVVTAPVVSEPTPEQTETSLPQPTAPFSSPRPANLGENALHSNETSGTVTPPASPEPAVEVSSSSPSGGKVIEPLSTPVAPAVDSSDTPIDNVNTPEPAPSESSPIVDNGTAPVDVTGTPAGSDPTPADDKDETPSISSPTTPVS